MSYFIVKSSSTCVVLPLNIYLYFEQKLKQMLSRTKVIKSIKELPDSFSIEELFDRIIFLNKIEIGRQQSKAGKTFSTAEAKKKLSKWLK